ncbi:HAD family hydrolase [Candidatus Saganbacteria bacterium]|uniref:HAD family hydrolase n=1 Tax=Candidatus Saganbacteria bacterium TaxID=2575572 RepID=A0A9D6YVR0_UNCSA|nr:HAD family hydrolase [Candidatus Saganbacteria bacterium]
MRTAAFFDVDNTLVKGFTQKIFADYLLKKKELSFFAYAGIASWFIAYRLFNFRLDKSAVRNKPIEALTGKKKADLDSLAEHCFEEQIKPRIFPGTRELIKEHQEKGDEIILVSTSMDAIIDRIKEHLGLKFTLCTKLETRDGVYTGRIDGPIMYGENKVKSVRQFAAARELNLSGSSAYSDHISDLPLLELVGNPGAVNPDARLEKICRERKWPAFRFRF